MSVPSSLDRTPAVGTQSIREAEQQLQSRGSFGVGLDCPGETLSLWSLVSGPGGDSRSGWLRESGYTQIGPRRYARRTTLAGLLPSGQAYDGPARYVIEAWSDDWSGATLWGQPVQTSTDTAPSREPMPPAMPPATTVDFSGGQGSTPTASGALAGAAGDVTEGPGGVQRSGAPSGHGRGVVLVAVAVGLLAALGGAR